MNILHITPHLGGGVGSVICAWIKNDGANNQHTILSLDTNHNKDNLNVLQTYSNCNAYEGCWFRSDYKIFLKNCLKDCDVIILHWWNHPLTFDFIYNFPLSPCRLIVWCHAACLAPPYVITEDLLRYCDKFIFTSPVSYNSKEVKKLKKKYQQKFDLIWSTSGVDDYISLKKKEHNDFVVGYIGTVDFSKLNKNFIKMCSKIKNNNMRFEIYSIDSQDVLKKQAKKYKISKKITFGGKVPHNQIPNILKQFDVLGYPLDPHHYGTCEQALGESMAAGVVPVCLNNECEKTIIENKVSGFLCNSEKQYSEAIDYLAKDKKKLSCFSVNARKRAADLYSVKNMVDKWNELILNAVAQNDKKIHNIRVSSNSGILLPHELYFKSLGNYSKTLQTYVNDKTFIHRFFIKKMYKKNNQFLTDTKGSVFQYLYYFKDSEILQDLAKIAEEVKKCQNIR